MIFYFSGTGNSQQAAIQIAKLLKDDIVSINWHVKNGVHATFNSQQSLVFVTPTYCWRIPWVVEQWIQKADFQGNRNAYFVLTCGGSCGNAGAYARRLCEEKGLHFCGLSPVLMPENYLALGPTPSEAECQKIMEAAKPHIAALAGLVRAGEPFPEQETSMRDKLRSGPVNPLFHAFVVRDKGFTASGACTGCGACVRRCPLNNIRLEGARPAWMGSCVHCMACIAGCPHEAIEYGSVSQGRHRHYVWDDSHDQEGGQP